MKTEEELIVGALGCADDLAFSDSAFRAVFRRMRSNATPSDTSAAPQAMDSARRRVARPASPAARASFEGRFPSATRLTDVPF